MGQHHCKALYDITRDVFEGKEDTLMAAASSGRVPINVVPHFSRLHEWIALKEGYFQDEGLEPEMLTDVMHSVSSHRGDEYGQRPQDLPFVQGEEVANSACEWGTACNAGAGMGKVVPDLYSVGRYAIFVRPGSRIERLYELRNVPVGIGMMAGSHFTTLKTLGEVLPKEHVKVVHTGGPGQRLLALLDGEVEAANLLDPEIPIAEAKGLRKLAQGEFIVTFWVSPTISKETLSKFFGALKRAEEVLERNTSKYLRLWERNVPPALEGDYDYTKFGRGEKLVFEPYSQEMFEDAMQFAQAWGLHEHVRESRYEALLASVAV
jgi:ABC-type nitrate/sulfonate/bicarbonate transport system substrate-binding protein